MNNNRINIHRLYKPLIKAALATGVNLKIFISIVVKPSACTTFLCTFEQWFGPVHLIVGRNNINGEFWAIVSDEQTTLKTFAEYGLRFDVEESFLDDQSSGWNVQRSEIRSVEALSRLWFILAVATLYLTAQGVEVVASKKRRWIDPHWQRGHSYFRIGLDWVKTALIQGWKLIRQVHFIGNYDPSPVMASRKQHEARHYRLEFKIQTYQYPIP